MSLFETKGERKLCSANSTTVHFFSFPGCSPIVLSTGPFFFLSTFFSELFSNILFPLFYKSSQRQIETEDVFKMIYCRDGAFWRFLCCLANANASESDVAQVQ